MHDRFEELRRKPLQRAAFVLGVAVVVTLVRRGLFLLVAGAVGSGAHSLDRMFLVRALPYLSSAMMLVLVLLAVRWLERPPLRWLPRRVGMRRPPLAALLVVGLASAPFCAALGPHMADGRPPWWVFAFLIVANLAVGVLWTGFVFHQLHLRCRFGFLASLLVTIATSWIVPVLSGGLSAVSDAVAAAGIGMFLLQQLAFAVLLWSYVRWNANVWVVVLFQTAATLGRGFEGDGGGGWLDADGPGVFVAALAVLAVGTHFFAPGLAPASPGRVASAEPSA